MLLLLQQWSGFAVFWSETKAKSELCINILLYAVRTETKPATFIRNYN